MSTILRALKKLEQEKETLGTEGMPGISATAASKTSMRSGRFKFSKRIVVTTLICLAFLGISTTAGYFYIQSRQSVSQSPRSAKVMQSAPKPKSSVTPKQVPEFPKSEVRRPIPETPPTKRQPGDKIVADASDTSAQRPTVQSEKPVNRPLPGQSESKPDRGMIEASRNTSSIAEPEPPSPKDKAGKPEIAPSESASGRSKSAPTETASSDNETYASADRLTGNRLKIQAIVWSSVAEERMAVINSRIVREGSTVEGFSVVAIRSDDVIVKEQGRLYRVVFGHP